MSREPLRPVVRPMLAADLPHVDRIMRAAFDLQIGVTNAFGERDYTYSRWRASPDLCLVADLDGEVAGSNFVADWGSVGFFGPLSVRPDLWNSGIARALLAATDGLFDRLGTRKRGLYTFAGSGKHVNLYQREGYWPGHLTALLQRATGGGGATPPSRRFSAQGKEESAFLETCAAISASLTADLRLDREIRAVSRLGLGETLLVGGEGFAICHFGPDSEAGSGRLYVKFAAVRSAPEGAAAFGRLLDAVDALAAENGLETVEAGCNVARLPCYRMLLADGFAATGFGVAMHNPAPAPYHRPDVFALDDWR